MKGDTEIVKQNKDRVVKNAVKVDLHIHSALSKHKDGSKVADNNIDNIDKLIYALNNNGVEICAITDHDAFDYDLYSKLKAQEGEGTIKKVFPGVEFSVEYIHEEQTGQLHIVTLFDDSDVEKVKNIRDVLELDNGKPKYDRNSAFSEKQFLAILQEIDLNTIMIVHQKGSLSSNHKPGDHDANSLGESKLQEFLYTEYFEAYEFKNKKNEIFSKKYIVDKEYQDLLRLITGSDCHSWIHYPHIDEKDTEDFEFTWLKCLPTFRGLVMAMTDYTRIKRTNSFFSVDDKKLTHIDVVIDGEKKSIPLSNGINVVIGDNSIGKSLMLHKLTSFLKTPSRIKTGYEKYLLANNFDIITNINNNKLFLFDTQGGIRDKFEDGKLNTDTLLASYYPKDTPVKQYTDTIDEEVSKYCDFLSRKISYTQKLNDLNEIEFFIDEGDADTIALIIDVVVNTKKVEQYNNAIAKLKEIIQTSSEFMKEYSSILNVEEQENITSILGTLSNTIARLSTELEDTKFHNTIINKITTVFSETEDELSKIKGDTDKMSKNSLDSIESAKSSITELVKLNFNAGKFEINVDEHILDPLVSETFRYRFIKKLSISKFDNEYIYALIKKVHSVRWNVDQSDTLTEQELIASIKHYPDNEDDWKKVIQNKVKETYSFDFKYKPTVLDNTEKDLTKEMSNGKNMQIYFDLISYNSKHKGLYLVDQPEDSVSQKAIKEYLLARFKKMSEHRQVIIVTHNPQFIVNLDVDNVIFISKSDSTNKIIIRSGALEYEGLDENGEKYRILDIVANNIDGGIETINRRWKRYEKTNTIVL